MATSHPQLSVVIVTRNAATTLEDTLRSIKQLADEIVVMDMYSTDDTVKIAKRYRAQVHFHPAVGYVEPARNPSITKASGDWILVLDADETVPPSLAKAIRDELIVHPDIDAYFLPRKNMIFDKWVRSGWWPDYVLRLFRKGVVDWPQEIHAVPNVRGTVHRLPAEESYALVHQNYQSIDQYIDRAQRYAGIMANERQEQGQPIMDPLNAFFDELLRRFYVWEGNQDAYHGWMLSVLQGCTRVIESAKHWELQSFSDSPRPPQLLSEQLYHWAQQAEYWERKQALDRSTGIHWYIKRVQLWLSQR